MAEWLPPGKLVEYYVEDRFGDVNEADRQLYFAVIRGEVRARHQGKILGPEELKKISKRKWDPQSDFGLPADIGLSVEDAERVFAGTLQGDRSIIN
jgi:hypothetical protein